MCVGTEQCQIGQVTIVKVLGAISLVDNEKMDWKILVLQIDDPLAKFVNSIADVEVCALNQLQYIILCTALSNFFVIPLVYFFHGSRMHYSPLKHYHVKFQVHIPGALAALRTFFTNYKPGVVNTFATMSPMTVADSSSIGNTDITRRNTEVEVIDIPSPLALGAIEALAVVSEAHLYWQQMCDKLDHDIL